MADDKRAWDQKFAEINVELARIDQLEKAKTDAAASVTLASMDTSPAGMFATAYYQNQLNNLQQQQDGIRVHVKELQGQLGEISNQKRLDQAWLDDFNEDLTTLRNQWESTHLSPAPF